MRIYLLLIIVSFLYLFGPGGCRVKGEKGETLFVISDITYQSWVLSADEHGTDIRIHLTGIDPEVEFISVTFRGITVPLTRIAEDEKTVLLGKIIFGESVLDKPEYRVTNEENSIRYLYHNREHIYPLEDIRRVATNIGRK